MSWAVQIYNTAVVHFYNVVEHGIYNRAKWVNPLSEKFTSKNSYQFLVNKW